MTFKDKDDDSDDAVEIKIKPPFAIKEAAHWAISQPITNLLSLGLTGFVAFGFGYYVVKIVPETKKDDRQANLELIKEFTAHNKAVTTSNAEESSKRAAEHTKQVQAIIEGYTLQHKEDLEHAKDAARHKEELLRELMGRPKPLHDNVDQKDRRDSTSLEFEDSDFPLGG